MNEVISMSFPAKREYLLAIRLTVSAIAERMGFNIEDIEDIKLASAEGCGLLLLYRPELMSINMIVNKDRLDMHIIAGALKGRREDTAEELSEYLLEALVDECYFTRYGGMVTGVRFIRRLRQ